MSHLGQLATKSDLVELGNALRDDMGRLGDRVDRLSDRVDRLSDRVDSLGDLVATQARHHVVAIVSAMVGLTAIFTFAMAIVR